MRESSPGGSYGTASRRRPLRPEVFPYEVRHLTQLARDTEAHELMFYTPVYNSTEGLGSHELVATNLGIARLAGRDRSGAFHRPLGQDDRLGVVHRI
jgi:hypothetical protein